MHNATRAVLLAVLALAGCQAPRPSPSAADATGAAGRDVPMPPRLAIGEIQGRGARSAHLDQQVSIQGVVVGAFAPGLDGVFVQSERDDGDPLTAEGLFVEHGADARPVLQAGDRVQVSGRVVEAGDDRASVTGLRDTVVTVIGKGRVPELAIDRAPAAAADWERYEGMALAIAAPLTVTDNNAVASYGEVSASFDGRLFQPTEVAAPGAAADAVAADNARRLLLLDDGRNSKDPRELWFLPGGLDDRQPLRAGSVLRQVRGVLDQRRGKYRLQLTGPLQVEQAPRPAPPTVPGDLRIASLNLLNLFNGDGRGAGFPTERGAETAPQYQRQQQKLVAVVQALQPDIAALMEVENDGSGPDSTLAQFVAALNAAGPNRDYRLIDTGHGPGDDAIRVAMIYRASRVRPQGRVATLTGGPFAKRSRVPMAQAFRAGRGPVFVLAANHFKSKGCGRGPEQASGADADQHDGQSCWNALRTDSARRLDAWLAGDPTHSHARLQLIVGDLNAHALEDPLRALHALGWLDAFALAKVERPYSFVFDGAAGRLDHALPNAAMARRLRGAVEWHNNCDEAEYFDYHRDAEGDPYRASDHDPILLGFDLRGL
jgi:predicted extracellular nuclease